MAFGGPAYDAVVSLETIEHVPDPRRFVHRLSTELLAGGGIFIASVPVTPSMDGNPYHFADFTSRSFRALLKEHGLIKFAALMQTQRFNPFKVVTRVEQRMAGVRGNLLAYYLTYPQKALTRLASTVTNGLNNKY